MDPVEVRLRCLELAITQAKIDGTYGDLNHVAEISTKFYNHNRLEPHAHHYRMCYQTAIKIIGTDC